MSLHHAADGQVPVAVLESPSNVVDCVSLGFNTKQYGWIWVMLGPGYDGNDTHDGLYLLYKA